MIELIMLLEKHRKKFLITCNENCFCWDIEKYINEKEKEMGIELENQYQDWLNDYLQR